MHGTATEKFYSLMPAGSLLHPRMEPELLGRLDLAAVPAAVEAVFTVRATLDFPPLLRFRTESRPEL